MLSIYIYYYLVLLSIYSYYNMGFLTLLIISFLSLSLFHSLADGVHAEGALWCSAEAAGLSIPIGLSNNGSQSSHRTGDIVVHQL